MTFVLLSSVLTDDLIANALAMLKLYLLNIASRLRMTLRGGTVTRLQGPTTTSYIAVRQLYVLLL